LLPALCWSQSRSDFYAVTEDVAQYGIRFKAAVVPTVGETLTCSIRHTGSLETRVIRVARERFAVRVLRAEYPLRLVAQNLLALAEEQNALPVAQRAAERIVPEIADVVVTTPYGTMIPGRVMNVSATGAAVSVDEPIEVGTLIMIGSTPAKVARCFDNGIGAAFLAPLQGGQVDPRVVL
jgi:hypothetical protein